MYFKERQPGEFPTGVPVLFHTKTKRTQT